MIYLQKQFIAPRIIICAVSIVSILSLDAQADDKTDREEIRFFEQNVRPLLVEHCYECHSDKKQKGDLRVDSIGELLAGGESGPSVEPHKPDESLLIEAVRYESYEMPPSGKLPDEKIAILEQWIKMGAPWPGQAHVAASRSENGKITDEDREFWSFQPLKDPEPPHLDNDHWSRNDIDRFVFRKLSDNEIAPAKEASKEKLVRRLYFDLIGLPPSPEQIDEFLSSESPTAYEELVDTLLASPRHGEHMARFWLDLVRYAESDGFRKDDYRPDAWRYRDYVIKSFNDDKPFDQFTREQIAGDEISPHDPEALTATGFLRHGIYEYNQRDAETQWQDMLNDITDTVSDTFLGMGMGCARCHDHKFDPILQKDYFRLQAFFANIAMPYDSPLVTHAQAVAFEKQQSIWEEAAHEIIARIHELEQPKLDSIERSLVKMFPEEIQEMYDKPDSEKTSYEKQISHLVYLQVIDKQKTVATKFKGVEKKEYESLKKELKKFDHLKPKLLPTGLAVTDYGSQAPPIFIPSKERLGEIAPGFMTIFDPKVALIEPMPANVDSTGRRTTLANWLTTERHPLTTRVIVNRIWKEHFGAGIVDSPSDFGHLGEEPTHPELLDWLAVRFVENDWSLKWLHREIVLSATYRQASLSESPQAEVLDPTNRLLWRSNVRRLTAEEIRDAQLAATGKLDLKMGGPGSTASSSKRRSIYTKFMRNSRDAFLDAFDLPDRMTSSPTRNVTTSPSQSLLLINGKWTLQRAEEMAKHVQGDGSASLESQLREATLIAWGHPPGEDALARMVEYIGKTEKIQEEDPDKISPKIGTQVLEVSDDPKSPPVQTLDNSNLPKNQFTIQATVFLRSLYPDATVRTIASHWDSSTTHPGWGLGVTSTKSAYKPRHLIMQFVGRDASGARKYEVVPSTIHLELNHPYTVTVSVDLAKPDKSGVLFVVKDLLSGEVQTSNIAHQVVASEEQDYPFMLGGRTNQKRHRWDGWLDEVQLLNVALTKEEILNQEFKPSNDSIVGNWNFDSQELPISDTIHQRALVVQGVKQSIPQSLVDICHILLNSNEFIYID